MKRNVVSLICIYQTWNRMKLPECAVCPYMMSRAQPLPLFDDMSHVGQSGPFMRAETGGVERMEKQIPLRTVASVPGEKST